MAFELSASSLVSSSLGLDSTQNAASSQKTGTSKTSVATGASGADTVSISEEAYSKQRQAVYAAWLATRDAAQTETQAATNAWETNFGLKSGSTTLKNGNTQVTTIDGAKMERLEYKNGVLVKKETGAITGDRAVWDTQQYDISGAVTQKAHAELTGLGGTDAETMASLRRDVQWYENGKIVRELHDGMNVQASSVSPELVSGGELDEAATLEDMAGTLTRDYVASDYQADIVEYADGKVSQTASIHNRLEAENTTNRASKRRVGMDGHTTAELSNANALTVQFTRYDADGDVLVQANLTDQVQRGMDMTQTVAVSWYDQGELVRQQEGTLTMEPGEGQQLPARPGILETFGIAQETFSGDTPLSADGLLIASREENAGAVDAFVSGMDSDMAAGGFSLAENLAEYRDMDNPYSISFTSRTYRDGELAAVSTDTEEVRENRMPQETRFQTGKGLTEDDIPTMLRSSSHEESAYENGELTAHGELTMREFVQKDARGVFGLNTSFTGAAGIGLDRESLSGTRQGSLEDLDSEANAASTAMGQAAGMAVRDTRALFQGLGEV
jgi:hypothetical protein